MIKADMSKLRVEIKHYDDPWQTIKDATMTTIGKDKGAYPDTDWKTKLIMCEHSPIRIGAITYKIYNAPSFVHGHLVRHHVGSVPFISTLRADRNNYTEVPDRNTLQDGTYHDNFQSIIDKSRKRLCNCASEETQATWRAVLTEIATVEPELVKACVPNCVYRGFCPEMFGCGYDKTDEFQEKIKEYRVLINRGDM